MYWFIYLFIYLIVLFIYLSIYLYIYDDQNARPMPMAAKKPFAHPSLHQLQGSWNTSTSMLWRGLQLQYAEFETCEFSIGFTIPTTLFWLAAC